MNPYVPRVLAPCAVPPEPVEDDYAARHGDVDVAETPTRADFRDDVVEAVRAERTAGAFVVSRQRAMRVVLLDTPLLPPGYKGARAWHLFAVGDPPADENPLKLQHCFVRQSASNICICGDSYVLRRYWFLCRPRCAFVLVVGGAMRPGGSPIGVLSKSPSSARRGTKTPSATVLSP